MNELNHLEKHLESLIPRRPSAKLKTRLFPDVASGTLSAARPPHLPLMAWLTPCACVFLLFLSLHSFRPDFGARFPAAGGSNLLAGLSSNLLAEAAGQSGSEHENLWSSITFEWTKARHSVSTMDSFPLWKTNFQKL